MLRLSSSILVSRRSSASFSSFLIWDSKSFSFHSAGADHSAVSALRETDREEALLLVVGGGYIWGEEIQEQNLVRKFASSGGGKRKGRRLKKHAYVLCRKTAKTAAKLPSTIPSYPDCTSK